MGRCSVWGNVQCWEMFSMGKWLILGNLPYREMSSMGKCPYGKMSSAGKLQYGEMSSMGTCPVWEHVQYGEMSSIFKCLFILP